MKKILISGAVILVGLAMFAGMGSIVTFSYQKYTEAKEEAFTQKMYAIETEKTLVTFGEMVSKELDEYRQDNEVLQFAYTQAYQEEQKFNAKVDKHDYNKLAIKKPRVLERAINGELDRLHDEICKITGCESTGDSVNAEATETITGLPTASEDPGS